MKIFSEHKAIVLDLDYTIFDEYTYFESVFREFCVRQKLQDKFQNMCKSYYALRSSSKNIFKEMLLQNHIEEEINLDILFEIFKSVDCTLETYPDVVPFIREVKRNKLKLGLLSNGNVHAQANKVRNLGIEEYFDEIVFARMFGAELEKPAVNSFEHIKQKLGVQDDQILFVGDNPKTDFEGAKKVGGTTVRVLRGLYDKIPSTEYVDLEVKSLEELIDL